MIQSYFKFAVLPDEVKQAHKIKSKSRLDCVAYSGSTRGINHFTNAKGQLFLYLTEARNYVKSDSHRTADMALSNGSLNYSSIYIEDLDYSEYGFGNPNGNRLLKNGKQNPMYQYRQDGYLFVMNKDYSEIEVFIVSNGKNLIGGYYQKMIDGGLDLVFDSLRTSSTPFFDYGKGL